MAKYNLPNYTTVDGLSFPLNFRRGSANPLDNSSVWASYAEAVTYATTNGTAYVGQILSVVDIDTNTVTVYSIQDEAGTLKKVGTSPVGDESTITVAEDGTVSLYGVAGLELTRTDEEGQTTNITYQPLFVNGKLTWVEPSATTVEGLATEIEGLKTRISTIENAINDTETGLSKEVEDNKTAVEELAGKLGTEATETEAATGIYAELDTKADAADVYTKTETDNAIATAIAGVDHVKRVTLDSADDIDLEAADADQYIYMVSKSDVKDGDHYDEYMVINGALEKVGDWKVDLTDYAKTADVNTSLAGKVDVVEGSRLMTNDEGTKLEGIETGAQVNKIESVDTEQFAIDEDKKLTLLDITMGKVTGLSDALTGKVDVVEGSRLMTNDESTKLEGIETGAQVNKIESVDETQFAIDGDKKLTLLEIAMGKVTGLTEALAAVDANVIESVKVNGVALSVAEDKSVDISVPITSDEQDKVAIKEDGTMEVNNISISKITQGDEVLILNGGSSSLSTTE